MYNVMFCVENKSVYVYMSCIFSFLSDKYDDFISCAQNSGDLQAKTARMKQLVKELPICHYHTLGFLIKHLTNIAAHHQVSKVHMYMYTCV